MFQIFSLAVGLGIAITSAVAGNLDTFFVVLLACALLLMAIDAQRIKRTAAECKAFSFFRSIAKAFRLLRFLYG